MNEKEQYIMKTLGLLKEVNIKNLYSIAIGEVFSNYIETLDFIGDYKSWSIDVEKGIIQFDDKILNIDFLATESTSEQYWKMGEQVATVPKNMLGTITECKKTLEKFNLGKFFIDDTKLTYEISPLKLATIMTYFAPQNTGLFHGPVQGANIYVFIKDLPNNLRVQYQSEDFITIVNNISSTFNVNDYLMVQSFLINNDTPFQASQNQIVAKFADDIITFEFLNNQYIENIISSKPQTTQA